MKNLIRFCLLTTLFTTSLNAFATSTNMFEVESRFGIPLVTINSNLGLLAAYDLSFRFTSNQPNGMVFGYNRAGALHSEALFNGEATVPSRQETKRKSTTRSTAVLCKVTPNICALLNSGSGSYSSNYTPTLIEIYGAAQQGTIRICAGSTCEDQSYTTSPHIMWTEAATGTISTATQTSAAAFTNKYVQKGFTSPEFITSSLAEKWVYIYEGGSAHRILKCGLNASTARPESCSEQPVDLSAYSKIAGLRASLSGLSLFMVADSSVYRLAVDAATGDLTGAMALLNTGAVDLGTVTAISPGYTPNAFFVTSSSPSRLCYCEAPSEESATANCKELQPTAAALTAPTTISSFYYHYDGYYERYALAADGTTVKKFSVDLDAGTYSWNKLFLWDFGAVVIDISRPIAYQAATLVSEAIDFSISLADIGTQPALGTLITLGVASDREKWIAWPAITPATEQAVSGMAIF